MWSWDERGESEIERGEGGRGVRNKKFIEITKTNYRPRKRKYIEMSKHEKRYGQKERLRGRIDKVRERE